MCFNRIRMVLVNTSHPGNIGSVARAMKTMGFAELYLVSPQQFPHPKAYEMASGAGDVLDKAVVVNTLNDAIADCTLVVGTSARSRSIPWPLLTPREVAGNVSLEPEASKIAIVFGREQTGLTNEELQACQLHVQIPANPVYSSLNIAAAVQIMTYELRLVLQQEKEVIQWQERLANADEMQRFFIHLQEVLVRIDFLKMRAPRKLMSRLRRLFFRARPDVVEVNILRGMLTSIQETIAKAESKADDSAA